MATLIVGQAPATTTLKSGSPQQRSLRPASSGRRTARRHRRSAAPRDDGARRLDADSSVSPSRMRTRTRRTLLRGRSRRSRERPRARSSPPCGDADPDTSSRQPASRCSGERGRVPAQPHHDRRHDGERDERWRYCASGDRSAPIVPSMVGRIVTVRDGVGAGSEPALVPRAAWAVPEPAPIPGRKWPVRRLSRSPRTGGLR